MSTQTLKIAGTYQQLALLTWKNWLLIRRNKISAFVELFLAISFVMLLLSKLLNRFKV